MRVFVQLPEELDVAEWGARHTAGEVPDATPYGLDKLRTADIAVRYRKPLRDKHLRTISTKVRDRFCGHEPVAGALALTTGARASADVVLCMDERTGIPAALGPRNPAVVSGITWLDEPTRLNAAHASIARRALRRMAAVFTQCPGLTPVLSHAWDLDPARVHEVSLGIDPVFYAEQPWPERKSVVASIGSDRMRDHRTLISAVSTLRSGGLDCTLELATTMDVTLPETLGVVHRHRMGSAAREMYQRSSVVAVALHPNRVGSGLTVVLEAMASGRPIVVTANEGVERYVRHGVDGLLVPPGDPDALAEAIGTLLADPRRAREMGAEARRAVLSGFTSAHMAADLRRVLQAAVQR